MAFSVVVIFERRLSPKTRVENAPKMSEANRREGAKRGEAGRKV